MGATIHSENYRKLLALIRSLRIEAGLTQTELADRLDRPQSWVSKVEVGERRIDVEELRQLCVALEVDPAKVIGRWLRSIR